MKNASLLAAAFFLLFFGQTARAQDYAQNSIYVEGGGNALFYSINYDRRFSRHLSGRLGLMVAPGESSAAPADEAIVAIIPVMANYLVGTGSHRLELGGGPVVLAAAANTEAFGEFADAGLAGVTTTFGYRYQPLDGGFVFRIGVNPFYSDKRLQLWGGVSLGYAF